jgi:hypothetical protein
MITSHKKNNSPLVEKFISSVKENFNSYVKTGYMLTPIGSYNSKKAFRIFETSESLPVNRQYPEKFIQATVVNSELPDFTIYNKEPNTSTMTHPIDSKNSSILIYAKKSLSPIRSKNITISSPKPYVPTFEKR